MKHLFLSPHPDDAEIGCGGLIHQLRAEGQEVAIAVCAGEGDLVMAHTGATVSFSMRVEEQRDAAKRLGDPEVIWLALAPAAHFDLVPQADFICAFDELFPKFDVVYTPLPSYNADHRRVFESVEAAFRPGRLDRVTLYAYEQPFGNRTPAFGKTYVELSHADVIGKCAAIAAHHSQVGERIGSIYGPDAATKSAFLRGMEIGVIYAEVLYLMRATQLISRKKPK